METEAENRLNGVGDDCSCSVALKAGEEVELWHRRRQDGELRLFRGRGDIREEVGCTVRWRRGRVVGESGIGEVHWLSISELAKESLRSGGRMRVAAEIGRAHV